MTKRILLIKSSLVTLILLILSVETTKAQDTIKVEPGFHYSKKEYPYHNKQFVSMVKRAREDIVYGENHKRIEYCYYHGKERICYGTTYKVVGDSLYVDSSAWHYQKINGDQYFVKYSDHDITTTGFAKSLIPLEKTGIYYTISNRTSDTLWQADYSNYDPSNMYDKANYCFYDTKIEGKVYEYNEVDEIPSFLNKDSINTISLRRTDYCICEPYYFISSMVFIITDKGEIKNVRQAWGNLSIDCPGYIMDLLVEITGKSPVKPALVNGKPVNVRWFVTIDMMDDNQLKGPADFREYYLKNKNRNQNYWKKEFMCK
jgi:hypothetical protein